jgi:hypothetical protein
LLQEAKDRQAELNQQQQRVDARPTPSSFSPTASMLFSLVMGAVGMIGVLLQSYYLGK